LPLLLLLQVHSAVLAGSGKEVVIKVLRPGTEDVLLTDLNFVSIHGCLRLCWGTNCLMMDKESKMRSSIVEQ
jgi:hypothetical protein